MAGTTYYTTVTSGSFTGTQEAFLTFSFAGGSLVAQTQNPGFDARRINLQMASDNPTAGGIVAGFYVGSFAAGTPNPANLMGVEDQKAGIVPPNDFAFGTLSGNVITLQDQGVGVTFIADVDKVAGGIRITPTTSTYPGGDNLVIGILVRS
jgi:hypothetical protein